MSELQRRRSRSLSRHERILYRLQSGSRVLNESQSNLSRINEEKYFNAVYTRNVPQIVRYLDKGVNPNVRSDEYGVAPLHLLAERNDYALGLRLMQCRNINLEVTTTHGDTPLHLACMFNCKNFVSLLFRNGVTPNVCNRFGKTPLHVAIEREYYEIVRTLLENGASVNVLDCYDNTPLSLSIVTVNNLRIAKALIKKGVNMTVENKRSLHTFFEAVLKCNTIEEIDSIVFLLEHGTDINMKDVTTGRNCLHFVALTGYLELAIVLIERGAQSDDLDNYNRTPTRVAVEHGNHMIADYFRKKYRPPPLLTSLPIIYLWATKLKGRLAQKRMEQKTQDACLE